MNIASFDSFASFIMEEELLLLALFTTEVQIKGVVLEAGCVASY